METAITHALAVVNNELSILTAATPFPNLFLSPSWLPYFVIDNAILLLISLYMFISVISLHVEIYV